MSKLNEANTEFPIFDAVLFKDLIVVAGGGGGQKFGIPNWIATYSALTFAKKKQLDTKDVIYERLHAHLETDSIVALSESKLTVFEVTTKDEIVQNDTKAIFDAPVNSKIVSCLVGNNLFVSSADVKKLVIYVVEEHSVFQSFSVGLDDNLLAIERSGKKDVVFCVFASKVLAFNTGTMKFVAESYKIEPVLTRALGFFSQLDNVLGVVTNGKDGAGLMSFVPMEGSDTRLGAVGSQTLSKNAVTCCQTLGGFLAVGTVEGEIIVFWQQNDGRFKRFHQILAHQMPIKALTVKLSANVAGSKNDLVISSFGSDSMMKSFLVEQPKIEKPLLKWVILAVLLLAFLWRIFAARTVQSVSK